MIEKEIAHCQDPSTALKLARLLNTVKEEKIQQKVQKEVDAHLAHPSLDEEADQELRLLQQNCLGVLHSLNEKDFPVDNLFLRNLLASLQHSHPVAQRRIQNVLHSISLKTQ